MYPKLADLRSEYGNFKKGSGYAFTVRNEAIAVLEEAKEQGKEQIINEVEDMLLDILTAIQKSKCNCNRSFC
jgi:phosphoribosyl-ATP pyrophosphohydrolase